MKLAKIAIAILAASCASTPRPASVPDNLRVPQGQTRLLRAAARGAQIYACTAKTGSPVYEWVLKGPDAELFDAHGEKIGRHFAGPTWEIADGSRVVGEVMERSAAPGAIPLLLLRAKSNDGAGMLANVRYIQRLDTAGGVAPQAGCDAEHAGDEARVSYAANYDFYGPR